MDGNCCPKLTSFWLHFIVKEGSLKFTKGPPPPVAKFKAIIDTCTVFIHILCMCSCSCFLMAAKKRSKKKGKAKVGREENANGHVQKIRIRTSITFGSELWKEMGFPNQQVFVHILHKKKAVWSSQKGPLHELPNFRQWKRRQLAPLQLLLVVPGHWIKAKI